MINRTEYADVVRRIQRVFPNAELHVELDTRYAARHLEFELGVGTARCRICIPQGYAKSDWIGRELINKMANYLYNN